MVEIVGLAAAQGVIVPIAFGHPGGIGLALRQQFERQIVCDHVIVQQAAERAGGMAAEIGDGIGRDEAVFEPAVQHRIAAAFGGDQAVDFGDIVDLGHGSDQRRKIIKQPAPGIVAAQGFAGHPGAHHRVVEPARSAVHRMNRAR